MRGWRTSMRLRGGGERNMAIITSFKTFSILDAKGIIDRVRLAEEAEGKPKRKLTPVSRYLLDELIFKYFKEDAPRGTVLEMIMIEDNKNYGI